ncbi:MAG: ATPase P [Lachnospiraceae bacterium]
MEYVIPGYQTLQITHLILDYNGTIAVDGQIAPTVRQRLTEMSQQFDIYVLTADTHGNAKEQCKDIPVHVKTFPRGSAMDEKERIVCELGQDTCACLGNGRNDEKMFRKAALSIGIMETEGMYAKLMLQADLCVTSIEDGLDLFRYPQRLIAGLRG